ncbi:hypothetical protein JMJ77_0014625, partial [Colletotrichum scovillei]
SSSSWYTYLLQSPPSSTLYRDASVSVLYLGTISGARHLKKHSQNRCRAFQRKHETFGQRAITLSPGSRGKGLREGHSRYSYYFTLVPYCRYLVCSTLERK